MYTNSKRAICDEYMLCMCAASQRRVLELKGIICIPLEFLIQADNRFYSGTNMNWRDRLVAWAIKLEDITNGVLNNNSAGVSKPKGTIQS